MFIADRIIYLQMHKTGCSHITKILSRAVPGEIRESHSKLTFDPGNRSIIGSVRNPWDWYVSLWAYGCAGKGALYSALTTPKKSARNLARALIRALPNLAEAYRSLSRWLAIDDTRYKLWSGLYGDPQDVRLFRRWLAFSLSEEGKKDFIEGYAESNLRTFAGFMTYRFVSLYADYEKWNEHGQHLSDLNHLKAFFDRFSIVDRTIHLETLEHDLFKILKELGYEVGSGIVGEGDRTNSSKHLFYKEYYDEVTEGLVADQERFIIERYGYSPPSASADCGTTSATIEAGSSAASSRP
jgi:hypothetical protein